MEKRRIRQGDPISPLIFVLVMDYFSRIMNFVGGLPDFIFHPLCKVLKLNHLCFADDLMIFCKAHIGSLGRAKEALYYFYEVSGLMVNDNKSLIYIVGVNEELKFNLTESVGFQVGELPMKYLGVNLTPNKWKAVDCMLVEKITKRIAHWTSKLLSYAGRLTLINSVLFSLQVYWAGIFILSKTVIKEVHRICREFLWGGTSGKRIPLVAWDDLCQPKKFGGLNIKNCDVWNLAVISKQIWNIAAKKDTLWVKWIDSIYLKGREFWGYSPGNDAS